MFRLSSGGGQRVHFEGRDAENARLFGARLRGLVVQQRKRFRAPQGRLGLVLREVWR